MQGLLTEHTPTPSKSYGLPNVAQIVDRLAEEVAYMRTTVTQQQHEQRERNSGYVTALEQLGRRVQASEQLIALSDELQRLKQSDYSALAQLEETRYSELQGRILRLEERLVPFFTIEQTKDEKVDLIAQRFDTFAAEMRAELDSKVGALQRMYTDKVDALQRELSGRNHASDDLRSELNRRIDELSNSTDASLRTQGGELLKILQAYQQRIDQAIADSQKANDSRVDALRTDVTHTVDVINSEVGVVKHSVTGLTKLLSRTLTSIRMRASGSPQRAAEIADHDITEENNPDESINTFLRSLHRRS